MQFLCSLCSFTNGHCLFDKCHCADTEINDQSRAAEQRTGTLLPFPSLCLCQLKGSLFNPGTAKHMLKLTNPSGEEAVCPQLGWRHSFHKILVFGAVSFQVIQEPVQLMAVPRARGLQVEGLVSSLPSRMHRSSQCFHCLPSAVFRFSFTVK